VTLNIRVSTGVDDGEEDESDNVDLSSSDLELVEDGDLQTVGIRFRNVSVPRNATILAAWIQFQVDESSTEATQVTLRGQLSPNAGIFTEADGNISSRTRTSASRVWNPIPTWPTVGAAGTAQRTPDISNIISEIVNQGTWNAGNSLAIIITGTGHRVAEAYDGLPAAAPLLHIQYAP
jgi:hypothetical protein